MKTHSYHYFQFPLCLLEKVHTNSQEGLSMIIAYGVMKYADVLTREPPEDGESWKRFKWENEDKLVTSAKLLGVDFEFWGDLYSWYDQAEKFIREKEDLWGTYPSPGIKSTFILEARQGNNGIDVELMAALIAIKSIIGLKKFAGTYKDVIACRMIGCKKKVELYHTLNRNPILEKIYLKYSKRYHMDKIINELLIRGFLRSKKAYGRQIFLSDELDQAELERAISNLKNKKFPFT